MEALIHPAGAAAASLLGSSGGNSCWLIGGEGKKSMWSKEENKKFERALAIFDDKTPDRWKRVAEMIPGKSVWDVIKQYKELEEDVTVIEAGLVPIPGFGFGLGFGFGFGFGFDDDHDNTSFDNSVSLSLRKKSSSMASKPLDQERRKGVPWTEEEHRRFLLGLQKHGKGDWRSISRNFVISKTPTQVASHAQKYFLRQHSVAKDKKRPSIHDITTSNLMGVLPIQTNIPPQTNPFDHQSLVLPTPLSVVLDWGQSPNHIAHSSFDGVKFPGHDLYSCGRRGASYVA